MRRLTLALLLAAGADPLAAQAPMPPRALLVDHWTRQRSGVLAYIDAMPDSALRFRPTKGVRDFSEQIYHLAYVNHLAVRALLPARAMVGAPDTAAILRSRKALRAFTARSYDDILTFLRASPDSAFMGESELFSQRRPRWQWLEVAREHAVWTLGQTVPYLRLNGVKPPTYQGY